MISIPHHREVSSDGKSRAAKPMTVEAAMRLCWRNWTILLFAPFLLFLALMYRFVMYEAAANDALAGHWFIGTMAFLGLGTIGAFIWRSRLFDNYYKGLPVSPENYFKGMMIPWVVFELSGLLALVGCIVTNTLLPGMIPAMVAFVLFLTQWPRGHAMTDPVGDTDDPEVYSEPR